MVQGSIKLGGLGRSKFEAMDSLDQVTESGKGAFFSAKGPFGFRTVMGKIINLKLDSHRFTASQVLCVITWAGPNQMIL